MSTDRTMRAAKADGPHMDTLLARWAERDWLRPLDVAFADFLRREVPDASPLLILGAALASHQLGRGHACLDLAATLKDPTFALSLPPEGADTAQTDAPPHPAEVLEGLTLRDWQAALVHPDLVSRGDGVTPLVLVGPRLYLRRYWRYEQAVRAGIDTRSERLQARQAALPIAAMRPVLERLFPPARTPGQTAHWQKLACALAARSAFSIITGGPGTGKTTTVVRLLALLQALALAEPSPRQTCPGRALRIRLAAPTGKAAARLNESIAAAVAGLPLADLANGEAVRAAIPVTVSTLHRLLGSRPDTRRLRHHTANPLALDVLVIDEASMVDLEMMAAVLDALPANARLILLGDKDQLASVEAGAVLGELCGRAREGHYTPSTRDWLERATGEQIPADLVDPAGTALDQSVVMLRHSHRFSADSGIGRLAEAVNAGDPVKVRDIWTRGHADLALVALHSIEDAAFRSLVIEGTATSPPDPQRGDEALRAQTDAYPARHGYRHYLDTLRQGHPARDADASAYDVWARDVLQAHGRFQCLCALRRGPWGVEGLNQRIAGLLHGEDLIPADTGWYLGRPVLVMRNDYGLGLMNGDIGMTLRRPASGDRDWTLRVAFPAGDGQDGIKWILPSRLQAVETVYALTVHKSQGSEFSHAALVLPETLSPILTRELLYTGITRAREHLTLVRPGAAQVLEQAVQRRVLRASGLMMSPRGIGEGAEPFDENRIHGPGTGAAVGCGSASTCAASTSREQCAKVSA
ncbi:exodeoxyribonuclease V subunit alpha [Thiocapsa sp. UBA6158]|uniref:exodeoxyribonuclease V subunit alpha n=1 Tax=Thiocapsa sp. UBA6158 TaxID=1947692 RepID=UPI0025F5BBAD|nr:exodeoxyribonuclease V subunit alpha [Thiocapsa sp. UBA6158]